MKTTHFDTETRTAYVQLSRRNLETLLAKLDRNRAEAAAAVAEDRPMNMGVMSRCTIGKRDEAGAIWVTAVEDFEHYSDRAPGLMAEDLIDKQPLTASGPFE